MKNYLLKLADDTLIMAQRLSEWCGEGPYLEEDIALTNVALDYLGQSTNFYKYAASFYDGLTSEDDLAFLRYEHQYLNAQLVELPNEDYATTILKLYFFSAYQKLLYQNLSSSEDANLSALAQKSLKEVKYHYNHAKSWIDIFNNGSIESKSRLEKALENLWEYTGGLFDQVEGEDNLVELDMISSSESIYTEWKKIIEQDFLEFGISIPANDFMQKGGRNGIHTEYFGFLLCELQYMQRAYPNCSW